MIRFSSLVYYYQDCIHQNGIFFINAHVYIINGCYVKCTVTNMIVCDCCAVYYVVEKEYDKILAW